MYIFVSSEVKIKNIKWLLKNFNLNDNNYYRGITIETIDRFFGQGVFIRERIEFTYDIRYSKRNEVYF